jgi:hypothetical protein
MVSLWIFSGALEDPYEEFVVQKVPWREGESSIRHRSIRSYWDAVFVVRLESSFSLLRDLHQEILACGKYIQILRFLTKYASQGGDQPNAAELGSSGMWLECTSAPVIPLDTNPRYYVQLIKSQFKKVSGSLFDLLMRREGIMTKLRYSPALFSPNG